MPSDLPTVISSFGGGIDSVINFIFIIVGVWFVLAEAALIYMLVAYRHRKGKRASWLPAPTLKQQWWVLGPVVIVVLCDAAIEWKSHGVWEEIKGPPPPHEVLVRITGRQFMWSFQYAGADGKLDTSDDFTTDSVFHVPNGKNVRFQLESVDVLHSFWVPAMRLKQDAVPGRSIPGWFNAQVDGDYDIGCAELCGVSHTSMRAVLTVEPQESFDMWAAAHSRRQASLEVDK